MVGLYFGKVNAQVLQGKRLLQKNFIKKCQFINGEVGKLMKIVVGTKGIYN